MSLTSRKSPDIRRVPWSDAARSHLVLRATLGANILAHGLVRVGHAPAFADGMVRDFQATALPAWIVWPFALAIPFAETVIGAAVLVGLHLRAALFAGGALIAALTLGTCLRQAWETAGVQLVYALAYAWLAHHASAARLTVDALLSRGAHGDRRAPVAALSPEHEPLP